MCLIVLAWKVAPARPLVVAANRDEFHARPTAPARFWEDMPQLLAGRDLTAGGTWMGMSRNGRFAAITNFRDPARTRPGLRSRGELPLQFLTGSESTVAFLRRIAARADDYAGFNLLLAAAGELWYFSNSDAGAGARRLAPGIYGLSNAVLDTPWPKLVLARDRLRALLAKGSVHHALLRGAVADRRLADPDDLHPLGLREAMDHQLSAQFISAGSYGTRSTTTLWLQDEVAVGRVTAHWEELSFDPQGRETGRSTASFTCAWPAQTTGA